MRGREEERFSFWERDLSEQRSRDGRPASGARHFNPGIVNKTHDYLIIIESHYNHNRPLS